MICPNSSQNYAIFSYSRSPGPVPKKGCESPGLQFAEVKPGKFSMVQKSLAVRYFILPQCGAVQGFRNGPLNPRLFMSNILTIHFGYH